MTRKSANADAAAIRRNVVAETELAKALQTLPGDVLDERVLGAMGRVPRELFLPPELREAAYADAALPIGDQLKT